MIHKHFRKEINRLIDNELNEKEKKKLLQHLRHCKKCDRQYKSLLLVKSILSRKEKVEPSNYFVPEVISNLKTDGSVVSFMEMIAARSWSLIVVFTSVIFLFLGILIYTDITTSAEVKYNEGYEELLIAENGVTVNGASDVETSSRDIWQSIIIEE
jgi:hypothetical protein